MSTRKQREVLRQRRIEFDKTVEENRKKKDAPVKTEAKKRGRPKKKVD